MTDTSTKAFQAGNKAKISYPTNILLSSFAVLNGSLFEQPTRAKFLIMLSSISSAAVMITVSENNISVFAASILAGITASITVNIFFDVSFKSYDSDEEDADAQTVNKAPPIDQPANDEAVFKQIGANNNIDQKIEQRR